MDGWPVGGLGTSRPWRGALYRGSVAVSATDTQTMCIVNGRGFCLEFFIFLSARCLAAARALVQFVYFPFLLFQWEHENEYSTANVNSTFSSWHLEPKMFLCQAIDLLQWQLEMKKYFYWPTPFQLYRSGVAIFFLRGRGSWEQLGANFNSKYATISVHTGTNCAFKITTFCD